MPNPPARRYLTTLVSTKLRTRASEVESGWLPFVGVNKEDSAMEESKAPGPDHPRSNRVVRVR